MPYVYDIRGTHGSGKSSVVKWFIKKYGPKFVNSEKMHLCYYQIDELHLRIVGKYVSQCGGADTVKRVEYVQRFVVACVRRGWNVMVEGILISHTFARWDQVAHKLGCYRFVHLNPDVETCVARVLHRRKLAGNDKPFDDKNVRKDHAQISRVMQKLEDSGHKVYRTKNKSTESTALKIEKMILEDKGD